MGYDIFISYRRESGLDFAGRLADHLKNRGYKPFMDLEAMKSGRFDKQLYEKIEECSHFILILSPKSLNRCKHPDDWVRKEVEYALNAKKHIITIQLPNFTFPKYIPDSMEILRYVQAVMPSPDIFEHTVDRVEEYLNDGRWSTSDYETAISKPNKNIKRKKIMKLCICSIVFLILVCLLILYPRKTQSIHSMSVSLLFQNDDDWNDAEKISADVGDEIHYRLQIDDIDDKDNPMLNIYMDKSLKYVSGSIVAYDDTEERTFQVDEGDIKTGIRLKEYSDTEDITFDFIIRVVNDDLAMTGNDLIVKATVDNYDKKLERVSIVDIYFLDEGISDDTVVTGWGDSEGGRETYTTEQVNEEYLLGDKIVFNSISDWEPIGGDERDFVSARKDNGINAGKDNIWHSHKIKVTEEGTYLVRMYVHNDNPNGMYALAKDVIAHVTMPLETGNLLGIQCSIDSSNASPSRYWDGINFVSIKPFYLDFVEGSVSYENNGIGSDGGCKLRDEIITADGVRLGFDSMDGIIPGGEYYAAYISFKVKVVFVDEKDYFHVDARVRKSGEKEWVEYVDAEIGDEVEYAIKYENTTNSGRNNVALRVIFPSSMELVKDSVLLKNTTNPNGLQLSGDIEKWVDVGGYAKNAGCYISFKCRIIDSEKNIIGKNILRLWGQLDDGTITLQDSADAVVIIK